MRVLFFCLRRLICRGIAAFGFLLASAGMSSQAAPVDLLARPAPENPQSTNAVLMDVTRAGANLVAVGERGLVLISSDNGQSWQQASVPVSVSLTKVHFVDDRQGWVVGHGGVVLHTQDGGRNWVRQLDGFAAAQLEVDAAARSGDPGRQRNAARLLAEGADKPWLDVLFVDARRGWVLGAYGLLLVTADGGASWQSVMGEIDNPAGLHLYSMLVAGERLMIVGEQGAVFESRDGGRHFSRLESPYEGSFFGALASREGDVLAYGLRGHLWRLAAGSDDWQAVPLGSALTLTAGLRVGDGALLLADEAGRLYYSHDSGAHFRPMADGANGYVSGLVQAPDGAFVVAGIRGVQRLQFSQVQP